MNAPSFGIGGIAMYAPGQQGNKEIKMKVIFIIFFAITLWFLAMQTMKPDTQAVEACVAKTNMTADQCEFEMTR